MENQDQILDKNQVSIYYNLLQIWIANPTLRFNQLVDNLQAEYSNKNGDVLRRDDTLFVDAYYLEDEKFAKFLQQFVDDHS